MKFGVLSCLKFVILVDSNCDILFFGDFEVLLFISSLKIEFRVKDKVYKVVGGVDFLIRFGECFGIIGESGLGKLIIVFSIMGLVVFFLGIIIVGLVFFNGEELVGVIYKIFCEYWGDCVVYIF